MPKNTKEGALRTNQDIRNTAFAMVRDHGWQGVSFTTLSKATGVSRTGITHHFYTRKELYDAIVNEVRLTARAQFAVSWQHLNRNYIRFLIDGDLAYGYTNLREVFTNEHDMVTAYVFAMEQPDA